MFWFKGGPLAAPGAFGRIGRRARRAGVALATLVTGVVLDAASAWAQATTVPGGAGGGFRPDATQGPGGPQLQQLVNWGAGLILICCAGFIAMHAGRWGWGSKRHNMAMVEDGKEGVARGAGVAAIVAAAAGLVKFAAGLGGQIQ